MPLPPGTILQRAYLTERLRGTTAGRFVEVGAGTGELSRLLSDRGWRGTAYELSTESAAIARERAPEVDVRNADWLTAPPDEPADLVISAMVVEHLPDDQEAAFLRRARATLRPGGRLILLVPASPRHWGIEDEIAGHERRYTRLAMRARLEQLGFRVDHLAGLTYPLSNVLLPISNRLVARAERDRLALPPMERTMHSGHRNVTGKTAFPKLLGLVLNPVVLYPLHVTQKAFKNAEGALVLYVEATPADGPAPQ
jgi:SAM-dependent methyltransferase